MGQKRVIKGSSYTGMWVTVTLQQADNTYAQHHNPNNSSNNKIQKNAKKHPCGNFCYNIITA